jgi:hypothetical protein
VPVGTLAEGLPLVFAAGVGKTVFVEVVVVFGGVLAGRTLAGRAFGGTDALVFVVLLLPAGQVLEDRGQQFVANAFEFVEREALIGQLPNHCFAIRSGVGVVFGEATTAACAAGSRCKSHDGISKKLRAKS